VWIVDVGFGDFYDVVWDEWGELGEGVVVDFECV